MKLSRRTALTIGGALVLLTTSGSVAYAASPNAHHGSRHEGSHGNVNVRVLTPRTGDDAGTAGKGWIVDLKLSFPSVAAAAFTGPQLTGPGVHANAAPFPGTFSPGADDHVPGLVVLGSTTSAVLPGFSGPGTNLANLFNLTSITDQSAHGVQIQDTWIVGAPILGQDVNTTLTIAIIRDLNHDGVYNDAPAVVTDVNHDGRIDAKDLQALGVVGQIQTVHFHLAGASS